MREILFRGKRTNDGRWIEGYYMHHLNRRASPVGDGIKPEDEDHIILYDGSADWNMPRDIVYTHVDPETVGQYTGLHDKNGKRIFEGDILDVSENPDSVLLGYRDGRAIVRWDEDVSGFAPFACYDSDCGLYIFEKECEVIGNIHDNPELIGGKEDGT